MSAISRWVLIGSVVLMTVGGATALAGGITGTDAPARVPVPAAEFTATISDSAGVDVTLTRVTYNGEVFFYGSLGAGMVTVPFRNVDTVRFEPSQSQGKVVLFATLKDGHTARILVEDDLLLYGVAPFGNYSIESKDLRSIRMTATP